MIEINSLKKSFNKGKKYEVKAVNGVSLELGDTGLYAIFGKSGSGKSTLMNLIGGLDRFDEGSISIDGTTYNSCIDDNYRIDNIGYIFQNYCLDANLDVYENVAMGLRTIGVKDEEVIFTRTMTALANVDMEEYYKRDVTTLSGGQQQRVAIARAMAKGAKIILADEPTGNLDEYNTYLVMDLLKELSKRCLIILVTHEPDIVDKYADTIVFVKDGGIYNVVAGSNAGANANVKNTIFLGDLPKSETESNGIKIEMYGDIDPCTLRLIGVGGKYYLTTDANVQYINSSKEIKILNTTKEEFVESQRKMREVKMRDLDRVEPSKKRSVFDFKADFTDGFRRTFGKGGKKRNKILMTTISLFAIAVIFVAGMLGGQIYTYNHPNGLLDSDTLLITYGGDYTDRGLLIDYLKKNNVAFENINSQSTSIPIATVENNPIYLADSMMHPYRNKKDTGTSIFLAGHRTDDPRGIILTDNMIENMNIATNIQANNALYNFLIGREIRFDDGLCGYIEGIIRADNINIYADETFIMDKTLPTNYKIGELYGLTDLQDDVIYTSKENANSLEYDEKKGTIKIDDINHIKQEYPVKIIDKFPDILDDENHMKYQLYLSQSTYLKYKDQHVLNDFRNYLYVFDKDVMKHLEYITSLINERNVIYRGKQLDQWHETCYYNTMSTLIAQIVVFLLLEALIVILMFSSFSARIKEVGIYRAIGVSKGEILKKEFSENLSSIVMCLGLAMLVTGIIFMVLTGAGVLEKLSMHLGIVEFLVTFVIVIGVAVGLSILPASILLHKTPCEILAKYDL